MRTQKYSNFDSTSGRFRWVAAVAAITVVALSLFMWQQLNPIRPALAGAGDATGPVTITGMAEVGQTPQRIRLPWLTRTV